ncbi:MAG: hypothetical protein R3Y58_08545 [Eubacteriales bacterium]
MHSTITQFIDNLQLNPTDIFGIDGPCGSGKSTLAARLSAAYDIDVIHLDDFFLPLDIRTPERLAEIGGNVHYERFLSEVIHGIRSQKPFTYRKFSCEIMDYTDNITINNNKPIVIEGSYCLRLDFRSIYTKKIYLEIDATTQKQRLIHRVGAERFQQFETLWIPKESAYFHTFHIKDIADIVL